MSSDLTPKTEQFESLTSVQTEVGVCTSPISSMGVMLMSSLPTERYLLPWYVPTTSP